MRGAWARGVLFVVAFVGLSLAPIFPRVTQVRSQVTGHGGDVIRDRWTFDSLKGSVDSLRYARPEEHPWLYLALDVVLCAALAVAVSLALARLLAPRVVESRH